MILDTIKKRRAVFPVQYNGRTIEKDILMKVLEAANWAPTHRRTEPWRFKILRGDALERLGSFMVSKYEETEERPKKIKMKKMREKTSRSAAIILICMQRDPAESVPEWEEIAATAMAVQNMWLACTELGIGSYWSSPSLIKYMDEFVEMKKGERCLGLFYMGYFDMVIPTGERTPIEDKLVWLDQ